MGFNYNSANNKPVRKDIREAKVVVVIFGENLQVFFYAVIAGELVAGCRWIIVDFYAFDDEGNVISLLIAIEIWAEWKRKTKKD